MDAHAKKIKDILNGNRLLEIPYYQRAYVWTEELWKRFLDDITDLTMPCSKPHFIGSIILKQQQTPSMGGVSDIRTVIDGQQRLTTIAIFFKVLSLKLGEPWIFDDVCKCRSVVNGKSDMILAFRHNHIDKEAFEKIMNLEHPVNLSTDKNGNVIESDSQIINAYQFFLNSIDTTILNINSYTTILDKILIVGIDLTFDEDEQQIFDTINSLGVKLTTSELLKNYFFNENNYSEYEQFWKPVFEQDKEQKDYWDQEIVSGVSRPHLIDVFFAAYLTIKTHDDNKYHVTSDDKLRYARTEKLFESYKDFINKYMGGKKEDIMTEIHQYAQLFMNYFFPNCNEESLTNQIGIERINVIIFALKMSTMIPYILYLLINQPSEQERNAIFAYLEAYVMRRSLCHADTRGYYKLFSDSLLTNRVLTAIDLQDFINNKDENRVIASPTDEDVHNAIRDMVLVNDQNTGILYMLESRLHSPLSATILKGIKYYTLEHLMPKKWEKTWNKDGLSQEIIATRNHKLYTLGNLAIIPGKLNTSISNNTWQIKLNGKGNKTGLLANASGLITLDKYLHCVEWTEETIAQRAEELYSQIIEIWKR